jgi:NADH dehydrogenase
LAESKLDAGAPDALARKARTAARVYAVLIAATLGLILLGALVRAHGAGLACPDWPRCFGVWLPEMDMRIGFEWTHRLVAGSIALCFAALAVVVLRDAELRLAVRAPLAVGAVLLAVQIVLGGLTVLLGLAPWTVTAHLVVGISFAASLLWTALALRDVAAPRPRPALPTGARRAVWLAIAFTLLQIVLGGLVSSYYAGLDCDEWPTCRDGIWFPSFEGGTGMHLAHRTNAYLVVLVVAFALAVNRRQVGVARWLRLAFALVLVQSALGVLNVVAGLRVEVTGLHTLVAAMLALALAGALRETRLRPVGVDGPRRRVVIVGAGFGGLAAARELADTAADVCVIDRENYHAFLPLLYQVATSGLSAQDVTRPVRAILRSVPNASFRMGEVVAVHADAREVETADGARIPYDFLIVAAGSETEHFGNQSAARHAFGLHHVEDALVLRNHVLQCLEEASRTDDVALREALLGFVVVGGGPTGVELAGMLAEMRRHVVPRDFPGIEALMRVLLIEGRDRLLGAFPEPLTRRALEQVGELGVEVRLGALVESVDETGVTLASGERLPAHTVVWAAGIRGAPLAAEIAAPLGRGARAPVEPTLSLAGRPEVFAIGDCALVRGAESVPQVAQAAMQQGRRAAGNVQRALLGKPPLAFAYRDPGTMATIGRDRAVASVFGVRIAGRLAWLLWLVAHIVFLAGFRNRVVVFVNWIYSYFTYDLGLRSIIGPHRHDEPTTRTARSEDDHFRRSEPKASGQTP